MTLAVSEDFEHYQLPVLDGPWNQDVWTIARPLRLETSGAGVCAVDGCGRPAGRAEGDRARPTDVLCVAHRRRHLKQSEFADLDAFITSQGIASPIRLPRGAHSRKATFKPLDFSCVHPHFAHELRYVVSRKVVRNSWRDPTYVVSVVSAALTIAASNDLEQLHQLRIALDNPRSEWLDKSSPHWVGKTALKHLDATLHTLLRMLDAATEDPWDAMTWHAKDLGFVSASSSTRGNIHWGQVSCDWLRLGLQTLAKRQLQAGTRSWSTIPNYTRGGSAFSKFMEEETGLLSPEEVTRPIYLEFVSWLRSEDATSTDLLAANTLAQLLHQLREDEICPDLPPVAFLLRGENPVRRTRKPKPFPEDVLAKIDALLMDPTNFPSDVHLMLRVFRATGPRASEALTLRLDSLVHVPDRGYSLEYFQEKIDDWRRIPIPPTLGEALAAQRTRIHKLTNGKCVYFFPYFGPAPRVNTLIATHDHYDPWPYGAFSRLVWAIYQAHGITSSSITGEVLTGAQLHRFRHSIATGLLREGWSQYEVQKFLGQKSATMMQAYAEIHDDDLRDKYRDYLDNAIGIDGGRMPALSDAQVDVERMRASMVRATLPNGYCTLPEKQSCDFLPTPCLSCAFFKTTPTFLPIHVRQRDDSLRELDLARSDGRERAVQAHERTIERLNVIIDGLNDVSKDAQNG